MEQESERVSKELNHCPFCGSEAELRKLTYRDTTLYGIFCVQDLDLKNQHGHFIDNYASKEEAIKAWNRRINE